MALTFTPHLPSPTTRTVHNDLGFKLPARKISSHNSSSSLKNNPNQPFLKPKDQLRGRQGWRVEDVVPCSQICKRKNHLETQQPQSLSYQFWMMLWWSNWRSPDVVFQVHLGWYHGAVGGSAMAHGATGVLTCTGTCTGGGAAGCQHGSVRHLLHDNKDRYADEKPCWNP